MWNYYQITTEAAEQQRLFLALAEQRRLAQIAPAQPHPLIVWIGQQLIRWGQRLQAPKTPSVGSVALAQ
jgi:hypothetical protein